MKKLLKQLFCRHNYKKYTNNYYQENKENTYQYCTKCKKVIK